METLDRLGWAAGTTFSSYGVSIGVRTNQPGIMEKVRHGLPPRSRHTRSRKVDHLYSLIVGGSSGKGKPRRFHLLYTDALRLARTHDLDQLLEILESDIQAVVAQQARTALFVHAGVVGWKGRALIFPGKSMSGKTTLIQHLLKKGARYYSDEFAVLDRKGRVHPYPRSLLVREGEGSRLRRSRVPVPTRSQGKRPLSVGGIVITDYQQGRQWRPRRLTPGQSTLEMLRHTVAARTQTRMALEVLGQVAASAPAFKGSRGEADDLANILLEDQSWVGGELAGEQR